MTVSEAPVVEDPLLYTCDFFERHHDAVRKVVDALGLQQTDLTLRTPERGNHTECLDAEQNILRTFINDGVWHLYRLPRIAIDACGYVLAVNLPAIEMLAQQGISEQQVLNMSPESLFGSEREAEVFIRESLLEQQARGRMPQQYTFSALGNNPLAVDVLWGPRPKESTLISLDDDEIKQLRDAHTARHDAREMARATAWEWYHKAYWGHSILASSIAEKIERHFCPRNPSLALEHNVMGIWHDSGKDGWSEDVLTGISPVPDMLIQDHTFLGAYSVARSQDPVVRMGVLLHHEQYGHRGDTSVQSRDGRVGKKGYFGLSGNEIPRGGRAMRVADVVATMTARRPYNDRKCSPDEIIAQLKDNAGIDYQPDIALLVADNLREFCPEAYH